MTSIFNRINLSTIIKVPVTLAATAILMASLPSPAKAQNLDGVWNCVLYSDVESIQSGQIQVQGQQWRGTIEHVGYGRVNASGQIYTENRSDGTLGVFFQSHQTSNTQIYPTFYIALQNQQYGYSESYSSGPLRALFNECQRR